MALRTSGSSSGSGGSAVVEEDWEGEGMSGDGEGGGRGYLGGGERKRDRLGSKLRGALNFIGNGGNGGNSSSSNGGFSSFSNNNNPSSVNISSPLPHCHDPHPLPKQRRERHSIQVLPKSYSSVGLSNGPGAVKGIRDLEGFSEMRESEGRKKEGYLWCNGQGKGGSGGEAVKVGGVWDKCWCEVRQSQLIEVSVVDCTFSVAVWQCAWDVC
jgi:hypothetical protein